MKEQIKSQNNFTFNQFDKMVSTFLRDLNKGVDKLMKRINKHMCKSENLGPKMWEKEQIKILDSLIYLEKVYEECYKNKINTNLYNNARDYLIKLKFNFN
jgi:hypothetical protein